ncbi:MAG: ABC transporter permease [Alphaproteobacteria bacterium]
MRAILQIARREMKQYMATRGFWLGILMVPAILGIVRFLPEINKTTVPIRHYIVADFEGSYEEPLERAIAGLESRALVRELKAWGAAHARPGAGEEMEALFREWRETPPVSANAALERMAPLLVAARPDFTPPRTWFARVPLPPGLRDIHNPDELARALEPWLMGERSVTVDGAPQRLHAALIIEPPEEKGGPPRARYWSGDLLSDRLESSVVSLRSFMERVLNREYRSRLYLARGLDAESVAEVQSASVEFDALQPQPEALREAVDAAGAEAEGEAGQTMQEVLGGLSSLLPIGLAYMLLISIFSMAGILLTNVIEEKSNRIVELLLSSVTPMQLMVGKLIGVAAIGLITVTAWTLGALFALGAGNAGTGSPGGLFALVLSTGLMPAFLAYFIPGYLMYAAVFLGVGSMCNSISDAQGYLGPLMAAMFVPLILIGVILVDPNGAVARVISWIPLYTPYFMMLRLGANPPLIDVAGSYILMLATVAFLIWAMGRVFRHSILRTGQPPRILDLFRMARRR